MFQGDPAAHNAKHLKNRLNLLFAHKAPCHVAQAPRSSSRSTKMRWRTTTRSSPRWREKTPLTVRPPVVSLISLFHPVICRRNLRAVPLPPWAIKTAGRPVEVI